MSTTLPTAKLGKNGPQVTRLGYGAMGLSAFYGAPKPDEERFALLDKAYEAGEHFWDSAAMYGDNEELIGRWFKRNPGAREKIFLATKFAMNDKGAIDGSPEFVRESINRALKRLDIPFVDLFYVHRLDKHTPIEKTVGELKKIKQEGLIKHIGLSECSSDSLRRACKVEHIDCVQIEYSPFSLEIESDQINLLKTCRELGVAVVAYSPIGRGILGGKIRSPKDFEEGDFRRYAPRFSEENFPKNLELVDKITAIAERKNTSPSALTLAWLLAQGDDIFPIPGTTNIGRLEENLGALKIQLTKEEEQEIREACEKAEVSGDRYPEAYSDALFADTAPLDE